MDQGSTIPLVDVGQVRAVHCLSMCMGQMDLTWTFLYYSWLLLEDSEVPKGQQDCDLSVLWLV